MRALSFTGDNDIRLLYCGADFFPALIAAFDAAVSEIFLETYIFALDDTGNDIRGALDRAAQRGVAVFVITDWLGTGRKESNMLAAGFAKTGVNFRAFNPWFKRGIARTHRKLCVVDRRIARYRRAFGRLLSRRFLVSRWDGRRRCVLRHFRLSDHQHHQP